MLTTYAKKIILNSINQFFQKFNLSANKVEYLEIKKLFEDIEVAVDDENDNLGNISSKLSANLELARDLIETVSDTNISIQTVKTDGSVDTKQCSFKKEAKAVIDTIGAQTPPPVTVYRSYHKSQTYIQDLDSIISSGPGIINHRDDKSCFDEPCSLGFRCNVS